MIKRLFAGVIGVMMICMLVACTNSNEKSTSGNGQEGDGEILSVAYQYGLAYAPIVFCQEEKLIEEKYKEKTGKTVEIVWTQMSSGADINTGITSGDIGVGFMGIAPAITGISKGVGYKIFTNLSGQEHGLMTNDPAINSLGDIVGSSKQIALVNIGSMQHIILAKALAENGYDAHVLDSNIAAMKHPDGMTALEAGSVACHLTSNPYIFKERDNDSLHELQEVNNAWSNKKSFIIGVASTRLYEENRELYDALCEAVAEAVDTINNDFEMAAKVTAEYDGNEYEDELRYLKSGNYSVETSGVFELASFMSDNGFVEKSFKEYSELVFDNVTGD